MIGAIAGDIIGSVYEFDNMKSEEFPLFSPRSSFTDDSVLTFAVADCLLSGRPYAAAFKEWGRLYPGSGFGGMFYRWLMSGNSDAYNSFGNGSAMRVSPVGFAFDSLERVLDEAQKSAEVTHNHPEGIKGAQAIAAAIFLARTGKSKEEIRVYVETAFNYDLGATLAEIRPGYRFDETCPGSVPQAIIAFLESGSYEDAVRKAISIGGDADTLACMAGGIAQAFYKGVPADIVKNARERLDGRMLDVLDGFNKKFM